MDQLTALRKLAISELEAQNEYSELIGKIEDPEDRKVLSEILLDEKIHLEQINNLIKKLDRVSAQVVDKAKQELKDIEKE